MKGSDAVRFARVMAALGEVFDTPVSEVRVESYFRALGDLPIAAVEQAAARVIQEGRYFPRPVELREAIGATGEAQAERAWAALLRAVRSRHGYWSNVRFEPVLIAAVQRVWGTWPAASEALNGPVDDPVFLGQRKLFLAQYRLLLAGPPPVVPPYLMGYREGHQVPRLEQGGDTCREVVSREPIAYFPLEGPPVLEVNPAPRTRELPAAPPDPEAA